MAEVTRAIKLLAVELNIPFLVLSQLNRDSERGGETRCPRASELRDSGAIEQDADSITLLYSDQDPATLEDPNVSPITALVVKQRDGATGMVKLWFHKDSNRIEATPPEAEDPSAAPAPLECFGLED